MLIFVFFCNEVVFQKQVFLDDPPFIQQILIKLRVALTIVSSIELVGYVFR